jgi:transposase-like protein
MDSAGFNRIEQLVRTEMSVEQCVRIEHVARETNARQAVAAMLGAQSVMLVESRLCPRCGAGRATKHGHDRRGLQRFRCVGQGCGRSFTAVTGTCLSGMRMPDKWLPFVSSFVDRRSLTWLKDNLGISRKTGFAWRKRLLGHAAGSAPEMLGGIVEADETYFVNSFKGSRGWKRGNPPENRPPRYRGSGALKRGLSSEQAPVLTALDRAGHIVQGVLDRRSDTAIIALLQARIEHGSIICSDGHSSYPKLAQARSCEHRTIPRPVHTPEEKARGLTRGRPGALGLGRVDSYHEELKTSLDRRFRGVSTRFLPNYLALEKHLHQGKQDIAFLRSAIA